MSPPLGVLFHIDRVTAKLRSKSERIWCRLLCPILSTSSRRVNTQGFTEHLNGKSVTGYNASTYLGFVTITAKRDTLTEILPVPGRPIITSIRPLIDNERGSERGADDKEVECGRSACSDGIAACWQVPRLQKWQLLLFVLACPLEMDYCEVLISRFLIVWSVSSRIRSSVGNGFCE